MGKKPPYPRTIRFESAEVKIAKRADGRFAISWREDGGWRRTTRTTEDDAVEWAGAKARKLAKANVEQWVGPAEAEALKVLRDLSDGSPLGIAGLLGELRAAKEILGKVSDLAAVARWFRDHGPANSDPVPVRDAVKRFLAEYDGGSVATRRTFGTELDAFAGKHGAAMLHQVDEATLRGWVDRKTAGGAPAPRTVLNRITTLCTFFRRARDWGMLPAGGKTAPEKLRRPRIPDASRTIFTVEQGRKLIDAVREHAPRLEVFLLLGGWLGLRPSEAVKVVRQDLHFADGYLHATTETVQKTGQARFVPMDPRVAARLETLTAGVSPRARVCLARSREFLSVLAREKEIVNSWPVDVLRHSFCSYRLAIVGDVGRVAEEAGNSPKMIRDHYRQPIKREAGEEWFSLCSDE